MGRRLSKIVRDERGASAIEYGLIAALVIIAMLVGLVQLAATTTGMWNNVSQTSKQAVQP